MFKELLIGCGRGPYEKRCAIPDHPDWEDLTTLDNNADHNPDVVHDLHTHPLPFSDNEFDEIHAYEVLEHLGSQGDYKFFFSEFSEYFRILKPGGHFIASVPAASSPWTFGDPSHTRFFAPEWLIFLNQDEYENQVGKTAISDFRYIWKHDLKTVFTREHEGSFYFILQKPEEE